jgi:hypothetical protein
MSSTYPLACLWGTVHEIVKRGAEVGSASQQRSYLIPGKFTHLTVPQDSMSHD